MLALLSTKIFLRFDMYTAKSIRLNRIRNRANKRYFILPIDHGFTMGPIDGFRSSDDLVGWLPRAEIDAIVAHKGLIQRLVAADALGGFGVIQHINGMSTNSLMPDRKPLLSSVDHARSLGADGVSLQLNFNGHNDQENWKLLGSVTDRCAQIGMPTLLMLYDNVECADADLRIERFAHLLRGAIETGVDIAKIGIPVEDYHHIIPQASGDIDIVVAGGSKRSLSELETDIDLATAAGAKGLCIGRNIFAHENPLRAVGYLNQVVGKAAKLVVGRDYA